MSCTECPIKNPITDYCENCGEQLRKRCIKCHRLCSASAAFCGGCGKAFFEGFRNYLKELGESAMSDLRGRCKKFLKFGINGFRHFMNEDDIDALEAFVRNEIAKLKEGV